MSRTEHYNMYLPGQDEFYDVDVFNDNTRLIDGVLHGLDREIRPKELALTMMASAVLRPADHGLEGALVDVYLVGGGAGGRMAMAGGSGGGGGHCRMVRNLRLTEESYSIVVGAGGVGSNGTVVATGGGATQAFGITAIGGQPGGGVFPAGQGRGGAGGSGGGGEGGGGGGFGGGPGSGTATARGGNGAGNIEFMPFNPYDGVFYGCGGGGTFGIGGGAGGNAAVSSTPVEAAAFGRFGGGGGGGGGSGAGALSGGNGGRGGGGGGAGGNNGTQAPAGAGGPGIVYVYAVPARRVVRAADIAEPGAAMFAGRLGMEALVACDEVARACNVTVGVLQAGACVDVAVCQDLESAGLLLEDGTWPEADGVVVVPEGYGIGDLFDGEAWARRESDI